ncbi:MAG: DUF1800 family protein [Verrucomicrobiota bacterium]
MRILVSFLLLSPLAKGQSSRGGLDLNGDGMSDLWALHYQATALVAGADTDGDGWSNRAESIAGTNPFLASDRLVLQVDEQDLSSVQVRWPSVAGKTYEVFSSSDLKTWTRVGGTHSGTGAPLSVPLGKVDQAFHYRVSVSDVDQDRDGLTAYEESLLGHSDANLNSSLSNTGNDLAQAARLLSSSGSFQLGNRTLSGSLPTMAESSRFLQQATLGSTYATIQGVAATGIPTWLEAQFLVPATSHVARNNALRLTFRDEETNELLSESDYIWAWWDAALNGQDALRQRVAFALSEILVIGQTTDVLEDIYWGIATYYDILVDNAFGNYRDLLYQVATNPAMGHYLSHVKNRPTDLGNNLFPDENFAREIMQLFSIGLFELNQDGTRKQDTQGNDIPTYDNQDITQFAKVFTGLTYNPQNPNNGTPWFGEPDQGPVLSVEDYLGADHAWMGIEMAQYEPMHETGVKQLLNGVTTNGTLREDLDAAIDNLFYHPNTGPFLARLLIQRLVTSNPSPGYIYRVAAAFGDNGQGVRGDMKAVLRAIFLDPEARSQASLANPQFGKLREPLLRHTHLARAFRYRSASGPLRMGGEDGRLAYGQQAMLAPSVFNFYLPDHQPLGAIKNAGLVAPEFQITTATTTIKTLNFFASALPFDYLITNLEEEVVSDFSAEEQLIEDEDIPGLLDRLDVLLTRGQMTSNTRAAIETALNAALAAEAGPGEIARFAVSLVASSPDFAVLQ